MECLGPECANAILKWLEQRAAGSGPGAADGGARGPAASAGASDSQRGTPLFAASAYSEESPALRSIQECSGAIEHLEYAIYRRFNNQLTRAERARVDNSIRNALFKVERFFNTLGPGPDRERVGACYEAMRTELREGREQVERQARQARRAELKLGQLDNLTPEGFEDFVAELFEALGFLVDCVGGSGDEGADLFVRRDTLRGVVQCKYHRGKAVVGSPDLQKFLGTIHHTRSHKGFFVTTRTFTLAAERFAAENPIELVDGPRLVELVHQAMGQPRRSEPAPPSLLDGLAESPHELELPG